MSRNMAIGIMAGALFCFIATAATADDHDKNKHDDHGPATHEQGHGPVTHEQGHAPVTHEQGHAPVTHEQGHAPVTHEQGHAPVTPNSACAGHARTIPRPGRART